MHVSYAIRAHHFTEQIVNPALGEVGKRNCQMQWRSTSVKYYYKPSSACRGRLIERGL